MKVGDKDISDADIAAADQAYAAIIKAMRAGVDTLREIERTRSNVIDEMEKQVSQLERFMMGAG